MATPSGRDLAAVTPSTTASGQIAARDAGIATRQPETEAPAALTPSLVAGGPGQAGVAFRATSAPDSSLTGKTGKAGLAGLAGAQADATFDANDPIPPPAGWTATPQVARVAAPTTALPESAAGVLAMQSSASGRPAVKSTRAMAIEGAEPAAAAASQAGSEPNAVLQTDAAVAVSGSTDVAVHPTYPAPPMLPASVADQVTPVMLSAARNGEAGHRVTVSITPGELGQVNVTVERNGNGTMHIQVSAEHLATLELLRRSQDELTQALNQVTDDRGGHSLSFSLDRGMDGGGPGSGMESWFTQSGQQDARPSMPQTAYADDTAVIPASPAAAGRGGIDVTA